MGYNPLREDCTFQVIAPTGLALHFHATCALVVLCCTQATQTIQTISFLADVK